MSAARALCGFEAHDGPDPDDECLGTCKDVLLDCGVACISPDPIADSSMCAEPHCGRMEHALWTTAADRVATLLEAETMRRRLRDPVAVSLRRLIAANRSFAFTTLRAGGDRAIAHWAFGEQRAAGKSPLVQYGGLWLPRESQSLAPNNMSTSTVSPNDTPQSHSLRHFLRANAHGGNEAAGWFRSSNLQVAQLASVPHGQAVNRSHLEQVQAMLLGRNADEQPGQHRFEQAWLVATVECVPLLVMQLVDRMFGVQISKDEAVHMIGDEDREEMEVELDADVLAEVDEMNSLDNELHEWAVTRFCDAEAGERVRARRWHRSQRLQRSATKAANRMTVIVGQGHTLYFKVPNHERA